MKIFFISKFKPSINVNAAILLQLQNIEETSGIEFVDSKGILKKSYQLENFKGVFGSQINLLYPEGSSFNYVQVIGLGLEKEINNETWLKIGGLCFSTVKKNKKVVIFADVFGIYITKNQIMNLVLGLLLRSYSFEHYHTYKKENDKLKENNDDLEIIIVTKNFESCQKELKETQAIYEGINITKELINEPANILGTEEFVQKIKKLEKIGIEVQILNEEQLKKLKMNALLAVGQGSIRKPYLVIMKWNGDDKEKRPLSFVGKGVVFDSGGISIKPSLNMQDMKGDMGGAGAVVGLMYTLAIRKAKINVVGIVGLVENMTSAKAQRPGDIVTSMSGQTIEVVNTDAEGRMVLADALWYCKIIINPKLIIDLATLTYAIMISLGKEYAGLFSNNENLIQQLVESGEQTSEKVWPMPLGKQYDKLIDSQFADMKNSAGGAGAITAAQFLKRFVDDQTPWAHLDIAGVCVEKQNEFNISWASGFGVRLLNHLIKTYYEQK